MQNYTLNPHIVRFDTNITKSHLDCSRHLNTDAGRSKFQTITRGTPFTKCSWDPLQAMLPRLMIIHELSFMLFSFKIEAHSLKVL